MRHGASGPPTDSARGGACDARKGRDYPHCGCAARTAHEGGGSVKRYLGDRLARASLLKNFSGRGRPGQNQPLTLSLHPEVGHPWDSSCQSSLNFSRTSAPGRELLEHSLEGLSARSRLMPGQLSDQDMLVTWRFRSRLDLGKFI